MSQEYQVCIVGAGVAGSSVAYHLVQSGIKNILILEAGFIGEGSYEGLPIVSHASLRDGDADINEMNSSSFNMGRISGSSVFEYPQNTIKMMVNIYPCSSKEFILHHGEEGAKSYLKLSKKGLEIEKQLAKKFLADPSQQLKTLGSLYVCYRNDIPEFEEEFRLLKSLGVEDIEFWDDEKKVQKIAGKQFYRAIYFPNDCIIDSTSYSKCLINSLPASVHVSEQCKVKSVSTTMDGKGLTILSDGRSVISDHIVLATGGLHLEPFLAGILTPAWSYLVSLRDNNNSNDLNHVKLQSPDSPNFFTWGFTHDWAMCNNEVRCSGNDHFSALKPPRALERCESLAKWTWNNYPYLNMDEYSWRYGVYSETPDHAPIVGTASPQSKICMILGCNAWGQASLSYAASIIPSVLGYSKMSKEDAEFLKVLTIRRFCLLPSVMGQSFL